MASKQQIINIKNGSERVIQGLRTKRKEFYYDDTLGNVRENLVYSVYYTENKDQVFLTGIPSSNNSRVIRKYINDSIFFQYSQLTSNTKQEYPRNVGVSLSDSDYDLGEVKRYFARVANDTTKPIFEITEDSYNDQNNLFVYFDVDWVISGLKSDVELKNSRTIRELERDYPQISNILFPLQLWRPPKDSRDDLENKLSRLKK